MRHAPGGCRPDIGQAAQSDGRRSIAVGLANRTAFLRQAERRRHAQRCPYYLGRRARAAACRRRTRDGKSRESAERRDRIRHRGDYRLALHGANDRAAHGRRGARQRGDGYAARRHRGRVRSQRYGLLVSLQLCAAQGRHASRRRLRRRRALRLGDVQRRLPRRRVPDRPRREPLHPGLPLEGRRHASRVVAVEAELRGHAGRAAALAVARRHLHGAPRVDVRLERTRDELARSGVDRSKGR